jgi:hypothetical protein
MSAALKSDVPQPLTPQPRKRRRSNIKQPYATQGSAALVPTEPQRPKPTVEPPVPLTPAGAPGLFNVLSKLQLASSVLALAVVALALVSYGASVYIERQLNQASRRLSHLQRSEQQLLTANESLKSHMAQQADSPAVELMPPSPGHVIFLQPANRRRALTEPPVGPSGLGLPQVRQPLGY